MSQPERIVLLRSGRHLQVALDVLRRMFPGCHVTVIATPGTESARIQAGIAVDDWLTYDAHTQFEAWPMLTSDLPGRVWERGYDQVAVLWQDPEGSDRANVDRAASVLSPRGFIAITPDGTVVQRRTAMFLARELGNLVRSVATAAALGLALFLPALLTSLVRGRRQPEVQ
jgi:hypothetical protein